MSQYVQFFIKTKNNLFYPIGTFSRNSDIGKVFAYELPYEELEPITKEDITRIREKINEEKSNYESYIKKINESIDFLKTINDGTSLEERMETFSEYQEQKEDIQSEITGLDIVSDFINSLYFMIDEAEDDERWAAKEAKIGIYADSYVYGGWEVGNPNVTYNDMGEVIENKVTGYKK